MRERIRHADVAGMFYAGDADVLRQDIAHYLAAATPSAPGTVKALVVPHAGYMYSGAVAAFGYKLLADQPMPRRLILMGQSHRSWFQGVALTDVDAFRTPLGDQPVDRQRSAALAGASPLFSIQTAAHASEHCLEVQVPFIQSIWPQVPIVPLLFGEVDPLQVGELLQTLLEPGEIIIVSSDLSHYHGNATAHLLDRHFIDALLGGEMAGIARGEACGQVPALALTLISQHRGWKPQLLDYRTSGDVTGDESRVVGYAAIAYMEEE